MLLRSITKHVRDQNWFAVFLDFLIVVVGVFIGIQVANWNTEKQQQEAVDSYLTTIARNIATDLEALEITRKKRELADNYSLRESFFIKNKTTFNRDEINFAWKAFNVARELHYFNANTSGFESLKSSGVLDRLQGSDIESLLYDYYDLISQIEYDEKNHNDLLKLLWLQFASKWPKELDEMDLAPNWLTDSRFQSQQPVYAEFFSEKSTDAIYEQAENIERLVHKYEHLQQLGTAFVTMVKSDSKNFNAATTKILDAIRDYSSDEGNPEVMTDGQIAKQSYLLSVADSNDLRIYGATLSEIDENWQQRVFDYHNLELSDNSLHIVYPGKADWAGVWIFANNERSLDYSNYDTLQIELKGDLGGEKLLLNLEDTDDPQDGSSTRYELEITDEWQTYNIDLADFKTADLKKLSTVMGFVFLHDNAQSFSVRTIRFLDAEDRQ